MNKNHVLRWATANHITMTGKCPCGMSGHARNVRVHSTGPDRFQVARDFVCRDHGKMTETTRVTRDRAHADVIGTLHDVLVEQGSHVVRAI